MPRTWDGTADTWGAEGQGPRQALFPIGTVARLTGVPEVTLRNWERRYGVPHPRRSGPGERRFYSGEDVALIRHLMRRVAAGATIHKAIAAVRETQRHPERLAEALLGAARRLDATGVQRSLDEAAAALDPARTWSLVLVPMLRALGDLWVAGEEIIAAEHLASSAVEGWLQPQIGRLPADERPELAAACGPGEQHELGTMALAALMSARGMPMVYLGANTPLEALASVGARMGVRVLCITATLPRAAEEVLATIEQFASVAGETQFAYGGPGFEQLRPEQVPSAGKGRYLGATLDEAVALLEQWWLDLDSASGSQGTSADAGA